MVCVYCSGNTGVTNSRLQRRNNIVWRRRACKSCLAVFTSLEAPDLSSCLLIQVEDGSYKPFIREKLYMDVYTALDETSRRYNDAGHLTNTIIGKLLAESHGSAIPISSVISCSLKTLGQFSRRAHLKYAAEHASGSVRVLATKKKTTS